MISTLIDSNVLLDVMNDDPEWAIWSEAAIEESWQKGPVLINQIVYAELARGYPNRDALDSVLPDWSFARESLPWEAAYRAGLAHTAYRRRGGARERTLPDFFIGAHAELAGHRLLTRDARRYEAYFPTLELITPDRGL